MFFCWCYWPRPDSSETEISPEAEAESAHEYDVMPRVVGIAVGVVSCGIRGRVGAFNVLLPRQLAEGELERGGVLF